MIFFFILEVPFYAVRAQDKGFGRVVSLIDRGPNRTIWHPWDLREHALSLAKADQSRPRLVVGVHVNGHDTSLAATWGGQVVGVIELERLHKIRYFDILLAIERSKKKNYFGKIQSVLQRYLVPAEQQLCRMVLQWLPRTFLPVTEEPCQIQYDVAALVASGLGWHHSEYLNDTIKASEWVWVDHHHAHAAIGWFDSPFYHNSHFNSELYHGGSDDKNVTVILSYDGMGNDGTLRTFIGRPGNATLLPLGSAKRFFSYGIAYDAAASAVRDLAWGSPYGSQPPCPYDINPACHLALAGSFMAFAATGKFREEWRAGARLYIAQGIWNIMLWPSPLGGKCTLITVSRRGFKWLPLERAYYFSCHGADEEASRQMDRDFAATVQKVFEDIVLATLRFKMTHLGVLQPASLVVTGGCALNVKVNSFLARELRLPTHVTSAPGDHGLSLGAAWLIDPPAPGHRSSQLQFAGAPLVFGEFPEDLIFRLKASRVNNLTKVAGLLIDGAIIGVAYGRAEFGPRALGHRSFLAAAHIAEQKTRLNRLKNRRWYRPCAPIVLSEDLEQVFEPGFDLAFGTPYMSFAPPLQQWVQQWLPAISHLDNTARPQSVHQDDDPWMHSLLVAVRSIMSLQRSPADPPAVGVLINTSLNPKGKPIASDVQDVLSIFCMPNGNELDYVLLEEIWLFDRESVVAAGFCEARGRNSTIHPSHDNLPVI